MKIPEQHSATDRRRSLGSALWKSIAFWADPKGAAPTEASPADISVTSHEAFGSMMQGIGVIAGLTHMAFCTVFFGAGVDTLAYANMGSVLCYAWVVVLARRGKAERAFILTVVEVVGHAILTAALIGWDSGFHYYILLLLPTAVVSTLRPAVLKGVLVLSVMVSYLTLDVAFRHRLPPTVLPDGVIDEIQYFNVVGVMMILLFLAGCYYYMITAAEGALRDLATTDSLTHLHNRRTVIEVIRLESSRARRGQQQLSFVLCDLDHFKAINDTLGHDMGDAVLKDVSVVLAEGVRDVDDMARWGGEEFLGVLPGTDADGAMALAERLRTGVEGLRIDAGAKTARVTMTLGVATMMPGESAEQAISRADMALYAGKHAGRNRSIWADGGARPQSAPIEQGA